MKDVQLLAASSLAYAVPPDGQFTPPSTNPFELDSEAPHAARCYRVLGQVEAHQVIRYNTAVVLAFRLPEAIILAFRGTLGFDSCEGLSDWLKNANFDLVPWENMEVHGGFAQEANGLYWAVRQLLARWNGIRQLPVYLTGHSQGGALAVLLAYRLHTPSIARVVTFGAPNVGGEAFAQQYDQQLKAQTRHYQHAGDLVALLPLDRKHLTRDDLFSTQKHIPTRLQDPCRELLSTAAALLGKLMLGQITLQDALGYYGVGETRYIDFEFNIGEEPRYKEQLQHFSQNRAGGGPTACHSLLTGYFPAFEQDFSA